MTLSETEKRWQEALDHWHRSIDLLRQDELLERGLGKVDLSFLRTMRGEEQREGANSLRAYSTETSLTVNYDETFRDLLAGQTITQLLGQKAQKSGPSFCMDTMGFGRIFNDCDESLMVRGAAIALSNPFDLPPARKDIEAMTDTHLNFGFYRYGKIIDSRPKCLQPREGYIPEYLLYPKARGDLIVGNVLSNRTWKAARTWLDRQGVLGFDAIFCRPVLQASRRITDRFEHPDIYYYLLQRQYELLNDQEGILLTSTRGEAREMVILWMREAVKCGLEVDMVFNDDIDGQDALKVVRRGDSPLQLPKIEYDKEIRRVVLW